MSKGGQLTFYWHDYETFGADPMRDRPAQFAGIRTDAQLNVIGDPLVIFCKPADDFLPQPGACLVTGITPQQARSEGVPECDFIDKIHDELSQPGTCGVGYNSIRFDDEVTRQTLYRNFFDPYAREWQNGNSRWDIIDMVRTAYALRPEGIEWPLREEGLPSFRLEDLTAANGISHEGAHDALSDVHATIELARLVRDKQPKLFEYLMSHRDKKSVLSLLDIDGMKPLLHVSGMFGAQRSNISLIVPLAAHPKNRNEIICWDLASDPSTLFELQAEEIQSLLYTRNAELPEGQQRPGLKSVHINKCPVLVTPKMADPQTAVRLGIDGDLCRENLEMLRQGKGRDSEAFATKLQAIYAGREFAAVSDPDLMLYGGGFFSDSDKHTMTQVRNASPEDLASESFVFEDKRLPEMLFRYRTRNYPESLNAEERAQWEEYRFQRITERDAGASICMEDFQIEVETLLSQEDLTERNRKVLEALLDYADELLA